MNIIVINPDYLYYRRHIRDILEWNLKRTNSSLKLDNSDEFYNIVDPPDIEDPPRIVRLNNLKNVIGGQHGSSKRKQKSKKSRRSQKKRKVNNKTKKRRIIKRK